MEIRELNEADLESLIKLYEQLDGKNGAFAVEDALPIWKNEIAENPNIKYFGAVENGKVVSTCFCAIIPNLILFAIYRNTHEFISIRERALKVLNKIKSNH